MLCGGVWEISQVPGGRSERAAEGGVTRGVRDKRNNKHLWGTESSLTKATNNAAFVLRGYEGG